MMGGTSPGAPGAMPHSPFSPGRGGVDLRGMMPQGGPLQHPPVHAAQTMGMTSWAPSQHQPMGTNQGTGSVHRIDHADDRHREQSRGANPRTLGNGDSASFDSSHEIAASVLLLAASAMKEQYASSPSSAATAPSSTKDADDDSAADEDRNVPLKKRKTASGIMRKKSPETIIACHVSPHSENSKGQSAANSPNLCVRGGSHDGSPSASSYDLKDGQALHDSAKITDTKEIHPPTHVEIPHFPSVLYAVLTESEFSGKVLQWLPHGQSWKIMRWDALRRQVLPKYFSQLREEDGKDARGSIDAFLWHLSAWGFEEIIDGPDVGAYSHAVRAHSLHCYDTLKTVGGAPPIAIFNTPISRFSLTHPLYSSSAENFLDFVTKCDSLLQKRMGQILRLPPS